MVGYNLTEKQKQLLRIIVDHVTAGKVQEPIIPACSGRGCSIIGISGDFGRNLLGDLDALCDVELMGFRYSSSGNKIYTVKQAGYDAVENDFKLPDKSPDTQLNIGAIIQQMSGGNLQAVGLADRADIDQVINDPELFSEKFAELTNQLLEAIKVELSAEKLVPYIQVIEDLKNEVAAERPSPTVLPRLFSSLAFLGDVEGTISLTARVWPYIYPILVMAVEKALHAG